MDKHSRAAKASVARVEVVPNNDTPRPGAESTGEADKKDAEAAVV